MFPDLLGLSVPAVLRFILGAPVACGMGLEGLVSSGQTGRIGLPVEGLDQGQEPAAPCV
jgi:hypothetical protein